MLGDLRRDSAFIGYLAGIPLFVHWSALFLGYSAYLIGGSDVRTFILALISLVLGIVLHELGHGLAAKGLGASGLTITLWALGGLCSSRRDPANTRNEIIIVAAGPAVSLALWLASWGMLEWLRSARPDLIFGPGGPTLLAMGLDVFADIQFMILLFNILPIFPLDGGQLTYLGTLLATRRQLLARRVSLTLAVLGACGWIAWSTGLIFAFTHGGPDPVGQWLAMMAANPIPTLISVLFMAFLLRNAFLYLY